jgi:hypothetical protein
VEAVLYTTAISRKIKKTHTHVQLKQEYGSSIRTKDMHFLSKMLKIRFNVT